MTDYVMRLCTAFRIFCQDFSFLDVYKNIATIAAILEYANSNFFV